MSSGDGVLGRKATGCSATCFGVTSVGWGSSDKGEDEGAGVFPSIVIMLNLSEEIGGAELLDLVGGGEDDSSAKMILAEEWESWLIQEWGFMRLVEVED